MQASNGDIKCQRRIVEGTKQYTRGGKNTFFPYPFLYIYKSESYSVMSNSLWPHGLYSPWNALSQNSGVGSIFLLQGIFPTQRSNSGFWNCRQILYQLSHKGSPRILEWVAYSFSSGSSWPRNQPGSPSLHVDSLSTELSGKTHSLSLSLSIYI